MRQHVVKFFTEDYLACGKVKNVNQKARYYVYDSHERIVGKEQFVEADCEMNRRKNTLVNIDGIEVRKNRKYNL